MKDNDLLQQEIILATGGALITQDNMQLFREKLVAYIQQLINTDFEKLISLLYRLDVSESKLKNLLAEKLPGEAGAVIADAVIERQLEKIISRKKYSNPDIDIPEKDRW